MASRRELKKNVNYIAGELFMECLVNSLYVPGTDKTKADELMGRILSVQDEFIIIRHRHVCLPSQNAIVDKAVYCFFHSQCLLQVADSVNNYVYFFIKVFAEFLVETFYISGFGMADAADDVLTEIDCLKEQFAQFFTVFIFGIHAFYDTQTCDKVGNIIDVLF